MNLTPTSVQTAMNQTMGIIGNAHSVSANMVPISSATADAMLSNSTDAVNVSFAMAATSVMTDMSRADWQSVMGNISLALGSISNINYTAITGVFRQAQDPDIQTSLKNMTQRRDEAAGHRQLAQRVVQARGGGGGGVADGVGRACAGGGADGE